MAWSERSVHDKAPNMPAGPVTTGEALARLWPAECQQYEACVTLARRGEALPVALLGRSGCGKTWLLHALVTASRAAGDIALHVHLDRYFSFEGLAAHVGQRLVQLHSHLLSSLTPEPADPDALLGILRAAELAASEAKRAVVLGFSGWDAHLQIPPDQALFEAMRSLLDTLRRQAPHTLVLVEVRPLLSDPDLESLVRSGMVYFPVTDPGEAVVQSVLEHNVTGAPFSRSLAQMAAAHARGNLHRLVSLARAVSARAAAAGITEVGPVEWEALTGKGLTLDPAQLVQPQRSGLLQAILDWPAAGHIPWEDLRWRLRADGITETDHDAQALIEELQQDGALLGLEVLGEKPFFAFRHPELRSALVQAVLGEVPPVEIALRRKLQANITLARQMAASGHVAAALTKLDEVVACSTESELRTFRHQAAAVAIDIWTGGCEAKGGQRAQAAQILLQSMGPAAAPALTTGLGSSDLEVQEAATAALVAIGEPAASAVAEVVVRGTSPARQRAVSVLAEIPCEASVLAIAPVLDDEDAGARLMALEALARLGDDRVGERVAALMRDAEPEVRAAAVRCTAALGYAPAFDTLVDTILDEEAQVREAVEQALWALGPQTVVPRLVQRLTAEDMGGRTATARALAALGDVAVQALLGLLSSADERLRAAAVRAFCFFPAETAIPAVLDCLSDAAESVVATVAATLAGFGQPAVLPVAELLATPDDRVRASAVRTLVLIGEPAAPELQARLAVDAPHVRAAAAAALGGLKHAASVSALAGLLSDTEPTVRAAAVRALAAIGVEEAMEPVVRAMADGDAEVVAAAVESVSVFGEAVIPELVAHLTDEHGAAVDSIADSLAAFGTRATGILCAELTSASVPQQAAVLRVLGRVRDPACAGAVSQCLATAELVSSASDVLVSLGRPALTATLALFASENEAQRAAAIEVATRFGKMAVPDGVALLRTGTPLARASAATLLGRLKEPDVADALIEALSDPEVTVRVAAVEALGEVGSASALEPLVRATQDAAFTVASAAVSALRGFGRRAVEAILQVHEAHATPDIGLLADLMERMGTEALAALLEILASFVPEVRAGAARVLGHLRYEPAVPHIVPLLCDPEKIVATCAHEAMVAFGPAALPLLCARLLDASAPQREAALRVVVDIGAPAAPALAQMLTSDNNAQRAAGIWAAAALGEAAVESVAQVLAESVLPLSRRAAAVCLGQIGTPSVVAPLAAALGDHSPAVRVAAVEGLARVGNTQAITALRGAMVDEDEQVSGAAREAMASLAPASLPALLERLDDAHEPMRNAVAAVLLAVSDIAAPALIANLPNGTPASQAAAIGLLDQMSPAPAAEAVLGLLAAPDPAGQAARNFAVAHQEECLLGLMHRLGADDQALREAATQVCVTIGALAVEALVGVVEAGSEIARAQAIEALAKIGDARAVPSLIGATRDSSAVIRARAAAALAECGDPEAVRPLCRLVVDEQEEVRKAAIRALRNFGAAAIVGLIHQFELHDSLPGELVVEAIRGLGVRATTALTELISAQGGQSRAAAINCLTALRHVPLLATLPELLADDDQYVRAAVVRAAETMPLEALPHLVDGLMRVSEEGVALATDCLLVVGAPAVRPLIEVFRDRENLNRHRAASVLARLQDPDAIEPLIAGMGEEDEVVRTAAEAAVGSFGKAAVGPLLEHLEDANPILRQAVGRVLSNLGNLVRPALLDVLRQPSPERQLLALGVLREMGATEAVPVVADLIVGDNVLAQAAAAFLREHPREALQALRVRLGAEDEGLRMAAAEIMGSMGELAVEVLAQAVLEDAVTARLAAIWALQQIPGAASALALSMAASDPEGQVRAAAAQALVAVGALHLAVAALSDEDETVRQSAVRAMVPYGVPALQAICAALIDEGGQPAEHLPEIIAQFGTTGTQFLVASLAGPDPSLRIGAVRLLVALRREAAFPAVTELLADPEEAVRRAAARGLVAAGELAVPALVEALVSGRDELAGPAGDCLVRIGQGAVPHLRRTVMEARASERAAAVEVLVRMDVEGLGEDLVAWLGDRDAAVRIAAARGIRTLRYQAALPALLEGIDADTEPSRAARLEALCSFGEAAVPVLLERVNDPAFAQSSALDRAMEGLGEAMQRGVIHLLVDPSAERRLLAARAACRVPMEEAAPALRAAVTDEEPQVRRAAAQALSLLGTQAARPLLEHLGEPDPERLGFYADAIAVQGDELLDLVAQRLRHRLPAMRIGALACLGRAHRPGDFPALAQCLSDRVAPVRAAAARAVACYETRNAAEHLTDALHDKDEAVVEAALEGLGRLGALAFQALVPRLITPDGTLDQQVARALGRMGEQGLGVLRQYLGAEDPETRAGAAAGLGQLGHEEDLAALAGLLSDDDGRVRAAAVRALTCGGPSAAPHVAAVLWQHAEPAASLAVEVLVGLGNAALPALEAGVASAPTAARMAAVSVLRRIGTPEAARAVIPLLHDPDESVRVAAAQAAGQLHCLEALTALLDGLNTEAPAVQAARMEAVCSFGAEAVAAVAAALAAADWEPDCALAQVMRRLGDAGVQALAEGVGSADPQERALAVRGLGFMGATHHAVAVAAAAADAEESVRAAALVALRALGRWGIQALVGKLAEPDPATRELYAQALASLGTEAIQMARARAFDPDPNVRCGVLATLQHTLGPEDEEVAAQLIADHESDVRLAACQVLGLCHSPEAAAALAAALDDHEETVFIAAARSLARLGRLGLDALVPRLLTDTGQLNQSVARALPAFGPEGVGTLRPYLTHEQASMRLAAVSAMSQLGGEAVASDLAGMLADGDAQVREAAAQALANLGPAAVDALRGILLQGEEVSCSLAARSLMAIGPSAVGALVAGLSSAYAATRRESVRGLAMMGDATHAPHIAELLRDADVSVRSAATAAIRQLRYSAALPDLLAGIDQEPEELREARIETVCSFGREAVGVLLERMADPAHAASPALAQALQRLDQHVVGAAIELLKDPVAARRRAAAEALRKIGPQEAIAPLLETVLDEDEGVRSSAAHALAACGPAAARALLERIADPDELRRRRIAEAIVILGDAALDQVVARLEDAATRARAAATAVLGLAARPQDQKPLAAMLEDEEPVVRAAACQALAAYPNRNAALSLLIGLFDDDEQVSEAAIEALRGMGDIAAEVLVTHVVAESGQPNERVLRALSAAGAAVEPVLRDCLRRQSPPLRAAAALALASVSGVEAMNELLGVLGDPEPSVRQAGVEGLVMLGEAAAKPALRLMAEGRLPSCLAAADVWARVGTGHFEELTALLRGDNPGARAAAARALGQTGDERAGPHIVTRLRDPEPVVRTEAALALGRLRWVKATPHLLSTIEDGNMEVAQAAIRAVALIGEPAVPGLIARAVGPEGEVRDAAVYALARIGSPAVPELLRCLRESGPSVRVAALRGLALMGREVAVAPLVEGLSDPAPAVREEAFRGIMALGRAAVPELIRHLSTESRRDVLEQLVTALANLREAAIPEVVGLLQGPEEHLRHVAAEILGRMGQPAAPALRKCFAHRNPLVRALAVQVSARVRDPSMVPDLIELLEDPSTAVVAEAIRALAVFDDPRAVTPVVRCLGATSHDITEALAFALPRFGQAAARPLADLLVSDRPEVVSQATRALLALGKEAAPVLVDRLGADSPAVRVAAAKVLGELDAPGVVEPLAARLDDPEPEVRAAVARALGQTGAPALAAVLDRLREPSPVLSDAILLTLQEMTTDPVYALMERCRDADERMRLAAVKMAGRYGRDESVPTLLQRLHDTSTEINCAAAEALGMIGTEVAITALAEEALTSKPELSRLIRRTLADHPSVALPVLVRLASRGPGEPNAGYIAVAAELARDAPGIVDTLLSHSDERIRRAAAIVLGQVGDSQSLRSLVRKARSPDTMARRAALQALGQMGDQAIEPLAALLGDADADLQKGVSEVLAGLGPHGVGRLVHILEMTRDIGLRAAICAALGRARAVAAKNALVACLRPTHPEAVRVAAAAALSRIGDLTGMQVLQTALRSEDETIRMAAAEAIAEQAESARDAIIALVDDPSPQVRLAAARAFPQLARGDLATLIRFAGHADSQVRAAVAAALHDAPRSPEAMRTLLGLLQDEDESVCAAAVESLSVFGDAALEALTEEALSEDADRRYAACWALSQLGPRAVKPLSELAVKPAPERRADALRALGRIGDPRGRPVALAAMSDPDPRVRAAAVGAMRRLAIEEDGPRLVEALGDSDPNVRMVAASVVAAVLTDELRQQVVGFLTHPRADTRAAAAQVLRQDAHPTALRPLQKAVSAEQVPWVAELMEAAVDAITSRG